jgi:Carboxypeptidase regulatory-like domain/Putative zinc-finger
VTERIQSGIHPDADQMSLFLEGAATEPERARMLEHLAHCAACREMVFLAQGAEARPAAALEEPRRDRWWTGRWMPFGLAGAALAFLLALVIYMRQPVAPVGKGQMAGVQQPANPVIGPRAVAPEANQRLQPSVESGKGPVRSTDRLTAPVRKPSPAVASGSGGGMGAGIYQAAPAASSTASNEVVTEDARGNSLRFPENTAGAAPAGQAGATVPASPVPQQQAAQAPPSAAPQAEPAATQMNSVVAGLVVAGRNHGALQILHDQGAREGMGEVSGVVTDASGAVIARATVSLRSAADQTGREAVREVATAEDGRFRIGDVIAGRYELRVSARGFMTTSEPLELKSRDVAMLEPVLRAGSESETVTVEANNSAVETQQVEATDSNVVQVENLPGGVVGIDRVDIGDRVLTLDKSGNLYLSRNAGKSWKKIKPKWTGRPARLRILVNIETGQLGTTGVNKPKAAGAQAFWLMTDTGAVWTSKDGKHWRAGADGNP